MPRNFVFMGLVTDVSVAVVGHDGMDLAGGPENAFSRAAASTRLIGKGGPPCGFYDPIIIHPALARWKPVVKSGSACVPAKVGPRSVERPEDRLADELGALRSQIVSGGVDLIHARRWKPEEHRTIAFESVLHGSS